MKAFFQRSAKTCGYLIDNGSEDKKSKDTKNCVSLKEKLNLTVIKTV